MRSTWVGTYVSKMPNPEYGRSEYAVRQIDCTKTVFNCNEFHARLRRVIMP
jgi:hypothetical protein